MNSSYLLNDLRNFNEIFSKDRTYDNIKSKKNPGFHPLFKRYIFTCFQKRKGMVQMMTLPPPPLQPF